MHRWIALVALCTVGCSVKSYEVVMGAHEVTPEEAHYVIVQSRSTGASMRIYDCLSFPDGRTWDPTCRRVELKQSNSGTAPPRESRDDRDHDHDDDNHDE